jgi:hypothetical protein
LLSTVPVALVRVQLTGVDAAQLMRGDMALWLTSFRHPAQTRDRDLVRAMN